MGAFNINITGVGGHGCERKAKAGEKLWGRCGRFSCPDCAAYDFVQRMKQSGMLSETGMATSVELTEPVAIAEAKQWIADEQVRLMEIAGEQKFPYAPKYFERDGKVYEQIPHSATFTHWPGSKDQVVDDMLKNERKAGSF